MQNQFSVFVYTPAWTEIGIFFILSGYLLGKGFYKNKYTTDIKGMLSFWITRFIRVFPMYFLLLFISFLFICPEFFFSEKWKILIPLFTFTFSGECSHFSFDASWFISTIMQLYFAMPIVFAIIKKWFKNHDRKINSNIEKLISVIQNRCEKDGVKLDYYESLKCLYGIH